MNIKDVFINLSNIGPDRLEELVLHIAEMSEKDSQFLSTKLNKLVWAADFAAFCETGRTISRATYQKGPHGPIPRAMPIILERLAKEKRMQIKTVDLGRVKGQRPIALAKANLSSFSTREITMLDKVIAENFNKSGTQMSRETHKFLAYKVAEMGETIPFSAWLVHAPDTSPKHEKIAKEIEALLRDGEAA